VTRSAEDKQAFRDALRLKGNVKDAEAYCSINRSLHFRWKKRDPIYSRACDEINNALESERQQQYINRIALRQQQYINRIALSGDPKKPCKRCGIDTPNTTEFFDLGGSGKTRHICRRCDAERHVIKAKKVSDGIDVRRSQEEIILDAPRKKVEEQARREALKMFMRGLRVAEEIYMKKEPEAIEERRVKARALYAQNADAVKSRSRVHYYNNLESERLRVTVYKHSHPDRVVKWGDKRKKLAAEQADGSLTHERVGELFGSAKLCPYCERKLTQGNKTLDHLIALSLGGSHGIHNTLICCRTCNMRKNAKPFVEWIVTLSESCERRARKIYRQRYGAEPEQQTMGLNYG
jgi:5-methylcytosine-specific restriction endonuclease McrA